MPTDFISDRRRLARIRACRADLLTHGFDLLAADGPALRKLVARHLEYFQAMLGDDATRAQVLALIQRDRLESAADPTGRGMPDDDPERRARRRRQVARMTPAELQGLVGELRRRARDDEYDLALLRERTGRLTRAATVAPVPLPAG
jgi:hypothetical protein